MIAGEAVILGFQHYLVMLGTTVIIPTIIVPYMGGGNVSIFFSNLSGFNLLLLPYIGFLRSLTSFNHHQSGGEGSSDPNSVVRIGTKYVAANLVWNPDAGSDWGLNQIPNSISLCCICSKIFHLSCS